MRRYMLAHPDGGGAPAAATSPRQRKYCYVKVIQLFYN